MARRSSAAISTTPCSQGRSPPRVNRPANRTSAPPGSRAEAGLSVTTPSSSSSRVRACRMTPSRQVRVPILRSIVAATSAGITSRMSSESVCGGTKAASSTGCPAATKSSAGRNWSRSIRLRSMSAANCGTSPSRQESAPVAWLSPNRTWSSSAAIASPLTLRAPLASNSAASGAAGSAPRSTASALSKAPRSAVSIRTLPSNAGVSSSPRTMPSNSARPRSPPKIASTEIGMVPSSRRVLVASWNATGRPRAANVPSPRKGPSSERAESVASIPSIRSAGRPSAW